MPLEIPIFKMGSLYILKENHEEIDEEKNTIYLAHNSIR